MTEPDDVRFRGSAQALPLDLEALAGERDAAHCHVCDAFATHVVEVSGDPADWLSIVYYCDRDLELARRGDTHRLTVRLVQGGAEEREARGVAEKMVRHLGRVLPRDPVVGEYGRRGRNLPAPPAVVWADLTTPRTDGPRPWLRLLEDEVAPRVIGSEHPHHVVWSSLWPSRPTDWIDMTLEPEDGGTDLTFVVLTDAPPPDASKRGHVLKRVNQLLFADLRFTYGQ